jgi:hypothetical protein
VKADPQSARLIAALRGIPEPQSQAITRGAKTLGNLVDVCCKRYAIGHDRPEDTIQQNWPAIIGAAYAARSAPERINNSKMLVVQVANPSIRRELMFCEDRIMTALRALPDCQHIRGIVFRAG